jgi:hypothetical protein
LLHYIPTNPISTTDGQIVLDAALFHQGQKPAVEVGITLTHSIDLYQVLPAFRAERRIRPKPLGYMWDYPVYLIRTLLRYTVSVSRIDPNQCAVPIARHSD